MKFIYSFLFRFWLNCLIPVVMRRRKQKLSMGTKNALIGSVWSLVVLLNLIISGCGGNSSKECDYYSKLKEGNARNITAKGNQAISSLQDEIIACGFGNKSCVDMAVKNFGGTHNCDK